MKMGDHNRVSRVRHGQTGRLLLLGVLLLASPLLAQTSSDTKDKKDKPANTGPVSAGVSVDSARKSNDLPVVSDSIIPGETVDADEINQSAQFGRPVSALSATP